MRDLSREDRERNDGRTSVELETALAKYSGAILYVSHDNYFRQEIGGEVVQIGAA